MKTLIFSLTFVVTLVLYGAGFFVPETQVLENTVDGHFILNDAEMAQLVGGPDRYYQVLEEWDKGNGNSPPKCKRLLREECLRTTPVDVILDKFTCVDCGTKHDNDQYTWEEDADREIEYYCDIQYENICFLRKNVTNTADICHINLNTKCRYYAPVNIGGGSSW